MARCNGCLTTTIGPYQLLVPLPLKGLNHDIHDQPIPGNSTVSGTYRGKDAVKELFGKVAEQNFKITPNRFLADDDVVVVLTQVTAGGESAPQADVVTFRDGKIVKAQGFGDTAMAERVFGTK